MFKIPHTITQQQTEKDQFFISYNYIPPVISIIETEKINITAVRITRASIIPITEEAAIKRAERFFVPKKPHIPEETERQIFHESKLMIGGRKIAAITKTA